jgi:hypothetical protein
MTSPWKFLPAITLMREDFVAAIKSLSESNYFSANNFLSGEDRVYIEAMQSHYRHHMSTCLVEVRLSNDSRRVLLRQYSVNPSASSYIL